MTTNKWQTTFYVSQWSELWASHSLYKPKQKKKENINDPLRWSFPNKLIKLVDDVGFPSFDIVSRYIRMILQWEYGF